MGTPETCARTRSGGGASRDRTDDLDNAIVALSQLSYGPERARQIKGINAMRQSPVRGDSRVGAMTYRAFLFR